MQLNLCPGVPTTMVKLFADMCYRGEVRIHKLFYHHSFSCPFVQQLFKCFPRHINITASIKLVPGNILQADAFNLQTITNTAYPGEETNPDTYSFLGHCWCCPGVYVCRQHQQILREDSLL